jgi:hypothetical protein
VAVAVLVVLEQHLVLLWLLVLQLLSQLVGAAHLLPLDQTLYLAQSHRLAVVMAEQLLVNHLLLPAATVALVEAEMFGQVDLARVVLAAQETPHRHHQRRAQMAAQVVLITPMTITCKLAVAVEQAKQVKQVRPLRVVRAAMARHLLFLDRL